MTAPEIVARVIAALEFCKIDYLLVGAFASNAYGVPRSTTDADFVVVLKPGQVTALLRELGTSFEFDPQMLVEGITGSIRNVITYRPTKFEIELFRLMTADLHHQSQFHRRKRQFLLEIAHQAWIPAAEDVVIQKLRWRRRKDVDDAVNVLAVSGSQMDWQYLTKWTQTHGTYELLREILHEIPDFPDSPKPNL